MKLTVLGASRNTGKALVEQATERDDVQVTILARSPNSLMFTEDQLSKITVVKGDALVKEDLAKAIEGADVIVSSLGAKPDGLKTPHDLGIEEQATAIALEIIKETRPDNPPRFVMISSTGVGGSYDVPYLLRPMYAVVLKKPHAYKKVAEEAIKQSGVPYTIVRPTLLTSGKLTKKYRADYGTTGYTISRNDVAHFVLKQTVLEDKWHNASPSLAY
ncbi:NAD(P)-binding protein [Martensiomyces pterosporus]|nr:NAD(P)-binding protein [Martensiomyces pterosporus]